MEGSSKPSIWPYAVGGSNGSVMWKFVTGGQIEGASPALAAELTAFAREHLSHVKTPRRIDFRAELPRHDTGKLYKRLLKDEYWAAAGRSI